MNFFSFNFPLCEYFSVLRPPPPPISFLMVRPSFLPFRETILQHSTRRHLSFYQSISSSTTLSDYSMGKTEVLAFLIPVNLRAALIPVVASLLSLRNTSALRRLHSYIQATYRSVIFIQHSVPYVREAGFWNREKKLACGIWNPQGFFVVGVWNTTPGVRNPTNGAIRFQVPLIKNPKSTKEIQNSWRWIQNPRLSCIPFHGAIHMGAPRTTRLRLITYIWVINNLHC